MVFTLIGKLLAKEGLEFIYFASDLEECYGCDLRDACLNLEDNWRYKIVKVRKVEHSCSLHEGGVKGVDVEPLPIEIAVEGMGKEMEGSTLKCELNCDLRDCENFLYCSLANGAEVKILKNLGAIVCPRGKRLRRVIVERVG